LNDEDEQIRLRAHVANHPIWQGRSGRRS